MAGGGMGGSMGGGVVSGGPAKDVSDLFGPRVRKSAKHKMVADKKAMKKYKARGGK